MPTEEPHLSGALRSMADQVNPAAAPIEEIMRRGRRARRARTLGPLVAVGAVVTSVAVVTTMSLGPSTPAYAVVVHDDDRISVSLNRLDDPAEANRELHRLTGARVVIVLAQPDCPAHSQGQAVRSEPGLASVRRTNHLVNVDSRSVLTVRPQALPADELLVLTPRRVPQPEGAVSWEAQFYRPPGPTCVTP